MSGVGDPKPTAETLLRSRTEEHLRHDEGNENEPPTEDLRPITEQKRAEHLEALVRERTSRLQEAMGELEDFSYTLAHDLRAPLRMISGFSELLLAQCPDLSTEHRQYLQRSYSAAQRMDQLIVDSLNYNKIARQNFSLVPVHPGQLLHELIDSYPQVQAAKGNIQISEPFPLVLGDPALLTQCFSNLINNGLKFIFAGQVAKMRISSEDLGDRVRIWFGDNGIGIPEDCTEKIFEMFQRLNPEYEGTGIGLTLVRKAVQRMRGKVGVVSQLDRGSRFWLELLKPRNNE